MVIIDCIIGNGKDNYGDVYIKNYIFGLKWRILVVFVGWKLNK